MKLCSVSAFSCLLLLCLTLSTIGCRHKEQQILLRIENSSADDFEDVILHMPEKSVYFGPLPQGQTNYYQLFAQASAFADLSFSIKGQPVRADRQEKMKQKRWLSNGNYTYQVRVCTYSTTYCYQIDVKDDVQSCRAISQELALGSQPN